MRVTALGVRLPFAVVNDDVRDRERLALGWCLQLDFGWFAFPEFTAALGLGVDLRAEQERDAAEPEPGQQHHHCGERTPSLVVGAELADIEGEQAGRSEPDEHRERRPEAEETPAWMIDVRAEV